MVCLQSGTTLSPVHDKVLVKHGLLPNALQLSTFTVQSVFAKVHRYSLQNESFLGNFIPVQCPKFLLQFDLPPFLFIFFGGTCCLESQPHEACVCMWGGGVSACPPPPPTLSFNAELIVIYRLRILCQY